MPSLSEFLNNRGSEELFVTEVPIELIHVPEGRKASFAKQDIKNQALINSMEREGLLHPIGLRWVSDERLEVAWGRRRLWAAKQLKWEKIPACIGLWKEGGTKVINISENLLRRNLTAVQEAKEFKDFNIAWQAAYGADPGRKVGGLARARKALRDPVTKKFLATPKVEQPTRAELFNTRNSENDGAPAPATVQRAVAGSTPISEADTSVGDLPEARTISLAKSAGIAPRTARKVAAYMKAFTDDQLNGLGTCEKVTKADLQRLAKIKDPERRDLAITLICMNKSVDDAIKEAEGESDSTNAVLEHKKEEAVSDEDWVKIYCAKVYRAIENPTYFMRAAIMYRKTLEYRAACAAKIRRLVLPAHEDFPTKYSWHLVAFLCVMHPDNWTVCRKCAGLNKQRPVCDLCDGGGFEIKFEWPKRKK